MQLQLSQMVRGVDVTVFGDDFDGDPSVGIEYGPECVWATRDVDGTDFELTDEETEKFGIELTECYYEQE